MRHFTVIEAPSTLGVGPTGVEELPTALKAAGFMTKLGASYTGRIPVPPYNSQRDEATSILNTEGIVIFARRLAEKIGEVLEKKHFPLVLGGDCSIELGNALALRRLGRYGLFFMDGHADFYQPEAELYGEASSMELAFISGRGPDIVTNIDNLKPFMRDEDIVVFGYRDEKQAAEEGSQDIRNSNMHLFDLKKVRQLGITQAVEMGLAELINSSSGGFWIHLDADVLEDRIMPAVDYRLPDGGLSFAELSSILKILMRSEHAIGMSITIFNPRLDSDGSIAQNFVDSLITGITV